MMTTWETVQPVYAAWPLRLYRFRVQHCGNRRAAESHRGINRFLWGRLPHCAGGDSQHQRRDFANAAGRAERTRSKRTVRARSMFGPPNSPGPAYDLFVAFKGSEIQMIQPVRAHRCFRERPSGYRANPGAASVAAAESPPQPSVPAARNAAISEGSSQSASIASASSKLPGGWGGIGRSGRCG